LADQQRRTRAGAARGPGQQFAGDPATGARLREVLLRFHGKPRDYPIVSFLVFGGRPTFGSRRKRKRITNRKFVGIVSIDIQLKSRRGGEREGVFVFLNSQLGINESPIPSNEISYR